MPQLLKGLSFIGTAAMLWVGGGIIVHGLEHFGLTTVPHFIHELAQIAQHAPALGGVAAWLTFATCAAALGLVVGGMIVAVVHRIAQRKH
jgi:predicted DNA repair protein MutK